MMDLQIDFSYLSINSVLIFISTALFTWFYFADTFNYWSKRGVPSISPMKSLFQSLQLNFGHKQFMHHFDDQYKEFEGHRYGGTYQLTKPSLLIRDPEVIKETLIKGFSNFHDRMPPPDEETDILSEGNIAQLTGEKWRQIRQKVSPAFSSSKMKIMYENLNGCAQDLNAHLQKLCSGTKETELDVKELVSNYTMDVIAACAMGIKCNSIQNPNCEFKKVAQKIILFDLRRSIYMFLNLIHPKLPRFFGLKALSPEVEKFLKMVCKQTIEMKTRDASLTRKDFLQILMSIRSSELDKMSKTEGQPTEEAESSPEESAGPLFTENVLVGIMGVFLSAGLEPVASTLVFCLYELAIHPDIQDKIFKEIQNVKMEVGDDITYEDLKKFRYTEQVINETLRKYPVGVVLSRVCTEPFQIPDSTVVVEKGITINIPVYSIHHDPQYFPEPDKFQPERFSEEKIDKIVPGTYLPFGDGPRFCIAMRLALMDVKTMLITLVSNYLLHICAKTQKHIKFDGTVFTLSPKGGLWLKLQKRT